MPCRNFADYLDDECQDIVHREECHDIVQSKLWNRIMLRCPVSVTSSLIIGAMRVF